MKIACLLLSLLCVSGSPSKLASYNIDVSKITVSGFSSGGFFAIQFHVAYSKIIRGVGVIAGGPFWCARNDFNITLSQCTKEPDKIPMPLLIAMTYTFAERCDIDPVENLKCSQVYLLSGTHDTAVLQGVVKKSEEYYSHFVTEGNITSVFTLPAEHCFPTDDYGNNCSYYGSPLICNCNFSAAHEILKHVYPGVPDIKPSYLPENLFEFDQSEFLFGNLTSMDSVGYIYVPTICQSNKIPCKLHIAFHGCEQGRVYLNEKYAVHTGYGQYAEGLNTIVIFPQIVNSTYNTIGCWDWSGYSSKAYASKLAPQMLSIRKIIERVAHI